jgi:copper(I)-binding protein
MNLQNRRTPAQRWVVAVLMIQMFLVFLSNPANADVTSEPISGVTVEDAVASPASKGGKSIVRFRIINSSVDNISLQGLRSSAANSAALVLRDSHNLQRDVKMLSIQREEELDLSTSHISGELRDLRTDLIEGDYVDIELVFQSGAIAVEAHIHESQVN